MRNGLSIFMIVTVLYFFGFAIEAAVSPDNAADDYIKCFQRFKRPDTPVWRQIQDVSAPTPPVLPPELVTFIEAQRRNSLIADIDAASKIKTCDWKLDYTKGDDLIMPYFPELKDLATLLRADGLLAAAQGDYGTAINRNLAIWRMGHHRAGKTTIEYRLSLNLIRMGETGLRQTISTCPVDSAQLMSLKTELGKAPYQIPSIKDLILYEKEMERQELPKIKFETLDGYFQMIEGLDASAKKETERIRRYVKSDDPNIPVNPEWAAASVRYMENYYDAVLAALEKPYPEAMAEMEQVSQKARNDFLEGNDAAFLSQIRMPPWELFCNNSILIRTQCNALLTAIDVYRAAKQTGQMPRNLPNSAFIDYFSGKPFLYEVTQNGFRLRCRQEDLRKEKTWEWEYAMNGK